MTSRVLGFCVLFLSTPVSAGVLCVAPGDVFADVQSAVDAAVTGDTILVRAGTYAPFRIDGKSLTVIAESPGAATIEAEEDTSALVITNVAANANVYVRGLEFVLPFLPDADKTSILAVTDCAGDVWLEDCTVSMSCCDEAICGGVVTNSESVTLVRCSLEGGMRDGPLAAGLCVSNASVYAYESEFKARNDFVQFPPVDFLTGVSGGHGAHVAQNGFLFASGCTFQGGNASGGGILCCYAGDGGDGIFVSGVGAAVTLLDSSRAGGAGGLGGIPGVAGSPDNVVQGTLTPLAGKARSTEALSPIEEFDSVQVKFRGEDGDFAFVAFSPFQDTVYLPTLFGGLHVGPPFSIPVLGAIGVSDELDLNVPIPALPLATSTTKLYVQGVFLSMSGTVYLASPSAIITIDDAIGVPVQVGL